jgi:predicted metal-dependent peptidase
MSARQLKEELSRDQINRKLDSTYERFNHRLGYLEARLDVSVAKLQVIIKISYSILAIRDNNAGMYQQVHY